MPSSWGSSGHLVGGGGGRWQSWSECHSGWEPVLWMQRADWLSTMPATWQALGPWPLSLTTMCEYFKYSDQVLYSHKGQDSGAYAFSWRWSPAEAGTQPEVSDSVSGNCPPLPPPWGGELLHLWEYLTPPERWALAGRMLNPPSPHSAHDHLCEEVPSLSISFIH